MKSSKKKEVAPSDDFIKAKFYGTYVVSHPDRLDKNVEKKFKCTVMMPSDVLKSGYNFHAYFKNTQKQAFIDRDPEFIRFKNVVFDFAENTDGSEINDSRTFSLERLKQHCIDQEYEIDFSLYPGLHLREVVFEFFERPDRIDESEAFYQRQEQKRKLHGLQASFQEKQSALPKEAQIQFEEV